MPLARITLIAGLSCCPTIGAAAQVPLGHIDPPTLSTPRGFSQVTVVPPGRCLVFVSGQVAVDSTGRLVGPGSFTLQAEQVFENLRRGLAASGATFRDVVKVTLYLRDLDSLPALRPVRDRYYDPTARPASSLVEVSSLLRTEFLLEIEAIAAPPCRREDGP